MTTDAYAMGLIGLSLGVSFGFVLGHYHYRLVE